MSIRKFYACFCLSIGGFIIGCDYKKVVVSILLAEKQTELNLTHSQALILLECTDGIYGQNPKAIVYMRAEALWRLDMTCKTIYSINPVDQKRSVTFETQEGKIITMVNYKGFAKHTYNSDYFIKFDIKCSQPSVFEQLIAIK